MFDIAVAPSADSNLKAHIRATGTKDSIASAIIDKVVRMGIEERKKRGSMSRRQKEALVQELRDVIGSFGSFDDRINPNLDIPGMFPRLSFGSSAN